MKPNRNLMQKAGKAVKKAAPTILTCIGAVGVVATAVLAVKATPKALKRIEDAQEAKNAENGEKLTRMETIGACATCYAPAAITGIATIGCILGANTLNKRQQAALTTAYAMLSRSYRDYQHSVKKVFGEEGHKKVLENLMVEKTDPPQMIYGAATGAEFSLEGLEEEKHLFYDMLSKRYFEATPSQVLMAEYHTNRDFAINGGEISVKEFYDFLGLSTPEDLKDLCWFVSDYYYWIDFAHTKAMIDDGESGEIECWTIEMPFPPTLEPLED